MAYIELPDDYNWRWATPEEIEAHADGTLDLPHVRWVHGEIGSDLAVLMPQKCAECDGDIYPDFDDVQWSNVKEDWICYGCYETDQSYASKVILFDDHPLERYEDRYIIYVGDLTVMDSWGDEPDLEVRRTYHSTDGWRGYHETKITGWSSVMDGWTTGDWGDYTGNRKRGFNEWVEALQEGEIIPPCRVAVICDPTSNVFSTAITVAVPDEDRDLFLEWLGEDTMEELEEALG